MAASSTVVIKVKNGDMLRRFNAEIVEEKLMINFDGLRNKIHSLFNIAPETELMLTYIDEDSDVVALVDDNDLHDVVKQGLNPLRITVNLGGEKSSSQYNGSSSSSTPLSSPRAQQHLPNLNAGASERLTKLSEPLSETLLKLLTDLAFKAASSTTVITELVDAFSKANVSYLGKPSESQTGAESGVPERNTPAAKTKNSEGSEGLVPEANMERNEVNSKNSTKQNKKASLFDFNAVAAALDKQNENVPILAARNPEYSVLSHAARKKEKLMKKPVPSVLDKNLTEKGVYTHSLPKLGTHSGNTVASDTKTGGKSPTSIWAPPLGFSNFAGPIERYECPFSGTPLENISDVPPLLPATDPVLFRGNINQNDVSGNAFFPGVCCDGCGVNPIVGPRFKSIVKVDYDLCRKCFEQIGKSNDYIRIERPTFQQEMHLNMLQDLDRARYQRIPHVFRGPKCKLGVDKLDSRFIQDVNIFDGTVMYPSTSFTKIWRMRNNGTLTWPPKTQLVWIGGDKLSPTLSVEVQIPTPGLLIGGELDVAVDFISPELPGRYKSYWRMASPSGQKFGQRVWVLIQVDFSVKEMRRETVRNLNLNLLPGSSSSSMGPEIINVGPSMMVEECHPVANNQKKTLESEKPDADHELKFPINDSLLVGNGASTSIPSSSASPSFSYPVIEAYNVAPPLPSVSPAILCSIPPPPPPLQAPFGDANQPGVELPGKDQIEEKLLRELEEMGFKQVDLNKEALRMNEYDLEQAVDELCGVAEWDPILEELQEMGFNDTEMNKKLLKKNNGSIKRVVMDLIAGEPF